MSIFIKMVEDYELKEGEEIDFQVVRVTDDAIIVRPIPARIRLEQEERERQQRNG